MIAKTMERLTGLMPVLDWGRRYQARDLPGDMMAGLITAIMLVPQSMAYAMLAGLPPQIGLYASIAPLVLYGLFGSSRALAVGPVAIVSIMTASALSAVAAPGSPDYIAAAAILALLNGLVLLLLGLARAGFLINFLSHPVIAGFTTAASIVIGLSQVKHIFGVDIPRGTAIETIGHLWGALGATNMTALMIGGGSIAVLLVMRSLLGTLLERTPLSHFMVQLITKSGPLIVVAGGAWITAAYALDGSGGLAIVGNIPEGLPPVTAPLFDPALWQALLPSAALIGFVGYLESVSVAKALASKRRQKIDANQELRGLGAANIGSAFTGGYPVTGGFSRSMVNFTAGANTPLASILTAALVALSVALFTPYFYFVPRAVLAAIILVAISSLIDFPSVIRTWRYSKADGFSQLATVAIVLGVGIEEGIIAGILLSLLLYVWRTSRPHFAVVGQMSDSEHYRNIKRHTVRTDPEILLVRVDESLYFANAGYLEDQIGKLVADGSEISEVVLICSAVNVIDSSALETLETLVENLRAGGVILHLAEVKGPVMDRLESSHFLDDITPGQVFMSTHQAVRVLREKVHADGFDPSI